jgi:hypothetical protein
MTIKEVDDCGGYSAVSMNNRKIWHSRMGHVGQNQLQQLAKIVNGMNIKLMIMKLKYVKYGLVVHKLECLITRLELKLVDSLRGSTVIS